MMYDFGKLGKWSKESLAENIRCYMTFDGENFEIEAIQALYFKLMRCTNSYKRVFFMRLRDIESHLNDIEYNKSLLIDFKKYKETIKVIAKEFLKDDSLDDKVD